MEHSQKKESLKEIDCEKLIGSTSYANISANNNPSSHSAIITEECFPQQNSVSVQCLLKGDKVFSLSCTNGGNWGSFFVGNWLRKTYKFVTGNVIITKDWCESKLSLQIRWENGNIEKLRQNSTEIAYGDRVFVLDRQCISPGSKVRLAERPEMQGTVLGKRYLATAVTTSTKFQELIFEDIDTNALRRESHGSGYKDNKILFRGWLGITSGYRTRLHLQSKTEESSVFSIVVDGHLSQRFNIGDDINLGFKILRAVDFVGGENGGSNWLVNFLKYYNTTATILDLEIDQLIVYWIGKAFTPNVAPNRYELPNAPEEIIPYEELSHVHYLSGDVHSQMYSKSLWNYECPDDKFPVSNDRWAQKWCKIMDWDRWEYYDDSVDSQSDIFSNKYITLEIMYTRSVVDVVWSSGDISTHNSGDVLPIHIGSVWSDTMRFQLGSVVRDRMDIEDESKYGVISSFDDDNYATVQWITQTQLEENLNVTASSVSLCNVEEMTKYEFILKVNQCPLVSCGQNQKLGVVLGVCPKTFKTRVKLTDDVEEQFWPHEIVHYKCDILLCPNDNRWTHWYEHLLPPSGITQVTPVCTGEENTEEITDAWILSLNPSTLSPKKKFECINKVPPDNIFVHEELIFPTHETSFHQAMEREVAEMEKSVPSGLWVECYQERGDIFSAIVMGPNESIFEDFIFIFDIFIMENFPKSEPHINFRSMGVTLIPGHLCKSGAMFLPTETRIDEESFSFSYIMNLLLEVKDFLGLPLELIHEKNKITTVGVKAEGPEELYKFITLAVLDYTVALLRNPPKNWHSVIMNHFTESLPRIIERFKHGGIQLKHAISTICSEEGDLPKLQYETITILWNETFLKSVTTRITELEKISSSLQV